MQYAIDWATRKELKVCQVKTGKIKTLSNQIEAWEKWLRTLKPSEFYLEEGGGDSFKLLARKLGHKVFTTPGIFIKRQRDQFGLEKDDDIDSLVISMVVKMQPNLFREFEQQDEILARIYLVFKMREKTETNLVQEKNRLFALGKSLELLQLDGYEQKIIAKQENLVKSLQDKFKVETRLLARETRKSPHWSFFASVKGCGEVAAGGIISSVKKIDRFPHKYPLRAFAGMKKKKGDQNFSHPLKRALYFFAKGIIKAKNEKWYPLYLETKKFYTKKHPDWKKGKVDAYAMKFIETKFLDDYYEYCKDGR